MNPFYFEISSVGNRIDCGNRSLVMNEIDEYALEQALVLKNDLGGSVTVISAGGLAAQDALYVGKAKGADRAIRISTEYTDPLIISELLARAINKLKFDLIIAGAETSDEMTGQTGICLAEKLGLPSIYAVTSIEAKSNTEPIIVNKELGGGIYQIFEIQMPAVLCVQSGIQPLKYAAPMKIIRARKEPLDVFSEQDLVPPEGVAPQWVSAKLVSVFKPEIGRKAEIIEGEPTEIAVKIAELII